MYKKCCNNFTKMLESRRKIWYDVNNKLFQKTAAKKGVSWL